VDSATSGKDLNGLLEKIMVVNRICNNFITNYQLAFIHYSIDVTDIYWETEYDYCMERSTQVQSALDRMLYALADSPLRDKLEDEKYFGPGYFDDYDGETGRAFVVDKPITRERVDVFRPKRRRAAAQNVQKARKKRRNEQFLQLLQR
jgi:hypothetical protein